MTADVTTLQVRPEPSPAAGVRSSGAQDSRLLDPKGLDLAGLLQRAREPRETVVVMTVERGDDTVGGCVDALLEYTRDARVIVIDDACKNSAVTADLARRAAAGQIELIRHDEPTGRASTVYEALQVSDSADIAVVAGATEVGPGWLTGLARIARSRSDVGLVSALLASPGWPGHLSWAEIARAVTQAELPWAVDADPADIGDSSCLLVTREALNGFEFPESDVPSDDGLAPLATHARTHGLSGLVASRVFVRHVGGGGAAAEAQSLRLPGALREALETLRHALAAVEFVHPRRLYVSHSEAHTDATRKTATMSMLTAYQDSYLLESAYGHTLELSQVVRTKLEPLATWEAESPFAASDAWRQDYAEAVAALALNLGIELVHIDHLSGHPLTTLPELARVLGIPVVLAVNDFYLLCPAADPNGVGQECAGDCPVHVTGATRSSSVTQTRVEHEPWKPAEWHDRVAAAIECASVVVVPSNGTARLFADTFARAPVSIRVIEPGCDTAGVPALRREPQRLPGPIRILAIMDSEPAEDSAYLRSLIRRLGPGIEWHVLGQYGEKIADLAAVHGPVLSGRLRKVAAEIDPDLAFALEIRPAPHSPKLATLWSLGLPVLTRDVGAVAARIAHDGVGGILLPLEDPEAGARAIATLVTDSHALRNLRWTVPQFAVPHHVTASESYRALYKEVESRPVKRHRLGYMIQGFMGVHGSCEHVRVLRRLGNLRPGATTSVQQVFNSDIAHGPLLAQLDTLLVQRDASCPYTDAVIAATRAAGVRLVVELDDDLLHIEAAERMNTTAEGHRPMIERLTKLVRSADGVLASTTELADRLGLLTDGVQPVVVPNELDPRLWLNEIKPARVPKAGRDIRVLYMGTKTHLEDLLLLKPVMSRVADRLDRKVVLEIIGVADAFDDDEWVTRLHIPVPSRNYPDFVRWMRARQARWHAAVAPLVDNHFNRAKSDLKLLEYAMLDIPVVASEVGPYVGAEQLAWLTSNDEVSWVEALSGLLADPKDAARRAARAREHVLEHRMISAERVETWLSAIRG